MIVFVESYKENLVSNGRSRDDVPIHAVNSPVTCFHPWLLTSQIAVDISSSWNSTIVDAPGARRIFWKPFSCFGGS
eukprot:SAG31_NODE_503_length_14804_cov_32.491670_10_plen_76_part_00